MKITAQEVLESITREYGIDDVNELYKGLIAYNLGIEKIDEKVNEKLDEVIEHYYEDDNITSFINDDLFNYAEEILNESLL